jgi:tetratricopeptide (TPR) repeat protein
MKLFLQFIFLPCALTIPCFLLPNAGLPVQENTAVNHTGHGYTDYRDNDNDLSLTLADVDAGADFYAPLNHIYSSREAANLRNNLISQLKTNPQAIAIHWALLRYYANAPDFMGGNMATALQYAAYIFSINQYIGCLAYEYAYSKRKQPDKAEDWYEKSLTSILPKDMYWQEIKYTNTAHFSIKVTGNFNNWKPQNMYETLSGNYARKVMVPKCEHCIYKCIVDYTNVTNPSQTSGLTTNIY